MVIEELTAEVRERIKVEHAHRFPELRYFPKPDDEGGTIKLPVVIGNPTGSCKMPKGAPVSRAWAQSVTRTFGGDRGDNAEFVRDCVLWPPPPVWAQWCHRWPALPESVRPAIVAKYGGDTDDVSEPGPDVEAPKDIAEARAANPGSLWVRFERKSACVDFVVKAPSAFQWAAFSNAMKEPNADAWALALDLALACTVAATMSVAEVFNRWPGLALQIDREASYLAGIRSDFEEGEL